MANNIETYRNTLNQEVEKQAAIANKARAKGYDLEKTIGIKISPDKAGRIEGLFATEFKEAEGSGIAERIRELEAQLGANNIKIAFNLAEEIAANKFFNIPSIEKKIEAGVRLGLTYLTSGIVAAPLEGIVCIKLKKNDDGSDYAAVYFAGPIRAAGGTAQAVSVLLTDFIRQKYNIEKYKITRDEIERGVLEINSYSTRQYNPVDEEIRFMLSHLPVEVSGEGTEDYEVPNYKNLPRIETPNIRGGFCLVITEGLMLKAKKLMKIAEKMSLSSWGWIDDYVKLKEKIHTNTDGKKTSAKVLPNYKYLEELAAGRPIFGYPSVVGGFRLRYGRARTSGFAAYAIHPASAVLSDGFIAVGTQLKVERPGKSTVISFCDEIEGPIVKLKSGDVLQLTSREQAEKMKKEVESILFWGDLLISYGDFLHNNHILIPSGYVEEWWIQELEKAVIGSKDKEKDKNEENNQKINDIKNEENNQKINDIKNEENNQKISEIKAKKYSVSVNDALDLSRKYKIPLYPKYTFWWKEISKRELLTLYNKIWQQESDGFVFEIDFKTILEKLRCTHNIKNNLVWLEENLIILRQLLPKDAKIEQRISESENISNIDLLSKISGVVLREKAPCFIGCRMGRPEKAQMRAMRGSPCSLFPVGLDGGRLREVNNMNKMNIKFRDFFCSKCNKSVLWGVCPFCKSQTTEKQIISAEHDIKTLLDNAHLNLKNKFKQVEILKGVRGLSSERMIPERIEKGILRSFHNLTIFKDCTIRYDAIDVPITHFKPKEIGTSIEKLRKLGYFEDYLGNPLKQEDQICELFAQDVIMPENASDVFVSISRFVDDELEFFYNLSRYYSIKTANDLIGHLVIGLAPHTSAGIIGRIIGFTPAFAQFAHPYWHAAKRRNCDGDEDGFMLLMDALLNFSQQYLPNKRGTRIMDAPIVLTTILKVEEVDDEVYHLDVADHYPLEFYEAAFCYDAPSAVSIDLVENKMKAGTPYSGLKFTHNTTCFYDGPHTSSYKTLTTMLDKVMAELEIAKKAVSVEETDVANLVIQCHFIKDIRGNLRSFTTQTVRCTGCNEIFRRPPLAGICPKCKKNLTLTIHEGGIRKYLGPSLKIVEKYRLDEYTRQCLDLILCQVDAVFGKKTNQNTLF